MTNIKEIVLRDTQTGVVLSYDSLEKFKKGFEEIYYNALKFYSETYNLDEASFLKALEFNFNACARSYFKITDIEYQSTILKKKTKQKTRTGNGEGSLYYSEANGCWMFQYTDYKGDRKTLKQRKNEQVREFKARVTELKEQLNKGTYISPNNITVAQLCRDNIERKYKRNAFSCVTYSRHLQTLTHIENDEIGYIPIQEITADHLQDFLDSKADYSNSYIEKITFLLKDAFKNAVKKELLQKDPMLLVEKTRSNKRNKKVRAFTVEEQKLFLDYLETSNEQFKNLFLLLIHSGMRVGEALALRKECVDFKNKVIYICATLSKDEKGKVCWKDLTKTPRSTRQIPITPLFEQALKDAINSMVINPLHLIFTHKTGGLINPSSVNGSFKRICGHLNILAKPYQKEKKGKYYTLLTSDCNTHMLRHTYATRCIESGITAEVLQKLLGHADIKTTINTYTDIFESFKKKEVDKYIAYMHSFSG